LQNAESRKNFQGLEVRGLVNWSSRILEDEDYHRGQKLCDIVSAHSVVELELSVKQCPTSVTQR